MSSRKSHPVLYEINTRCWLAELSERLQRRITLENIPQQEIESLSRLGFTDIWLMGVWTSGPKARTLALENIDLRQHLDNFFPGWQESDLVGSPYSIADYRVSDALGGDASLAIFRQRLNEVGLKLLLDFVPNHVGIDHSAVPSRPSLFVQGNEVSPDAFRADTDSGAVWLAHGRDPYFPPWRDTVQLDYRLAAVHEMMSELLLNVASKCDGVRCDMAMLVLNEVFAQTWATFPEIGEAASGEFWSTAVQRVRQSYPEFVLLAEAYWGREEQLHGLGFDYVYDKEVLDHLVTRNFPAVQKHLRSLAGSRLNARAHFLENHDEERAAARFGIKEYLAFATLILATPGIRFLHQGQLTGERRKVPVQLARYNQEAPDREIASFYDALLRALTKSVVGQGEYWFPHCLAQSDGRSVDSVFAIAWRNIPKQSDLVLVNLSATPADACIAMNSPTEPGIQKWEIRDLLETSTAPFQSTGTDPSNLCLTLPPFAVNFLRVVAS